MQFYDEKRFVGEGPCSPPITKRIVLQLFLPTTTVPPACVLGHRMPNIARSPQQDILFDEFRKTLIGHSSPFFSLSVARLEQVRYISELIAMSSASVFKPRDLKVTKQSLQSYLVS